jgi:SNF2 family DNA or RNA helicase
VELNAILFNTLMIRRVKKTILTQLPDKKRHIVRIEVKNEEKAAKLRYWLITARSFCPLHLT